MGRVVIPKDIRSTLDLEHVSTSIDGDLIVLTRHSDRCAFGCDSSGVIAFGNRVRRDCARRLGALAEEDA